MIHYLSQHFFPIKIRTLLVEEKLVMQNSAISKMSKMYLVFLYNISIQQRSLYQYSELKARSNRRQYVQFLQEKGQKVTNWVTVCGKLMWIGHSRKRVRIPRGMCKGTEGQGWWVAIRCSVLTARKAGYKGGGEDAKSHCCIFNYLIQWYLCTTAYHDTYGSNKHNY